MTMPPRGAGMGDLGRCLENPSQGWFSWTPLSYITSFRGDNYWTPGIRGAGKSTQSLTTWICCPGTWKKEKTILQGIEP